LPESEKAILEVTRMIREDFLQQSAYSDTDSYCALDKQYWMLKTIHRYDSGITNAIGKGVSLKQVGALPLRAEIARMRELGSIEEIRALGDRIEAQLSALEVEQ